jgi:HEAT repeat protein
MVRSFDRSALGSALSPDSPFARAQAELVRIPKSSVPVLVELLLVGDDIVAFLAADTLKRIGAPAVDPVSAKLGVPQPEHRRRVVELLESLPESPSDEPAILERLGGTAEGDKAWIVRAQAARTLGARAARRAQKGYAAAVLSRALVDPDPEVQRTALDALVVLGDSTAVPALIRRLERAAAEGDLQALRASQAALRRLTGEPRDLDPEEWWKRWSARDRSNGAETPSAPPAKAPR